MYTKPKNVIDTVKMHKNLALLLYCTILTFHLTNYGVGLKAAMHQGNMERYL